MLGSWSRLEFSTVHLRAPILMKQLRFGGMHPKKREVSVLQDISCGIRFKAAKLALAAKAIMQQEIGSLCESLSNSDQTSTGSELLKAKRLHCIKAAEILLKVMYLAYFFPSSIRSIYPLTNSSSEKKKKKSTKPTTMTTY